MERIKIPVNLHITEIKKHVSHIDLEEEKETVERIKKDQWENAQSVLKAKDFIAKGEK